MLSLILLPRSDDEVAADIAVILPADDTSPAVALVWVNGSPDASPTRLLRAVVSPALAAAVGADVRIAAALPRGVNYRPHRTALVRSRPDLRGWRITQRHATGEDVWFTNAPEEALERLAHLLHDEARA